MGRTVADVALLQNVLAGPRTLPTRPRSGRPTGYRPRAQLSTVCRVALCVQLGDYPVDAAVEATRGRPPTCSERAGVQSSTRSSCRGPARGSRPRPGRTSAPSSGSAISMLTGDQAELLMPYTRDFARRAAEHGAAPGTGGPGRRDRGLLHRSVRCWRTTTLCWPRRSAPRVSSPATTTSSSTIPSGTRPPLGQRPDDGAVQRGRARAGAVRAVRPLAERCADRRADRRTHIRRRHGLRGSAPHWRPRTRWCDPGWRPAL